MATNGCVSAVASGYHANWYIGCPFLCAVLYMFPGFLEPGLYQLSTGSGLLSWMNSPRSFMITGVFTSRPGRICISATTGNPSSVRYAFSGNWNDANCDCPDMGSIIRLSSLYFLNPEMSGASFRRSLPWLRYASLACMAASAEPSTRLFSEIPSSASCRNMSTGSPLILTVTSLVILPSALALGFTIGMVKKSGEYLYSVLYPSGP